MFLQLLVSDSERRMFREPLTTYVSLVFYFEKTSLVLCIADLVESAKIL